MAVHIALLCERLQSGAVRLDGSWEHQIPQLQLCTLCYTPRLCRWLAYDPGWDGDRELRVCWPLHVWDDCLHCFHWTSSSLPEACSLVCISQVNISCSHFITLCACYSMDKILSYLPHLSIRLLWSQIQLSSTSCAQGHRTTVLVKQYYWSALTNCRSCESNCESQCSDICPCFHESMCSQSS